MRKKIFIAAGEASGDLHGSNLVSEIRNIYKDVEFSGIGGDRLKANDVKIYYDLSDLAVLGVWEVARHYLKFKRILNSLVKTISKEKPDLVILIDYPGFNLRLAKEIKKYNFSIIYFISPQIWAWGRKRLNLIKRLVDKMVVFFKFEEELYRKNDINAEFVGHPLIDIIKPSMEKQSFIDQLGLDRNKATIALLPGSRKTEVEKLLPIILRTARLINEKIKDVQFVIAKASGLPNALFDRHLGKFPLPLTLVDGETYDVLNLSDFAIVASGTATLEAAIMQVPMMITYKASFLTWLIAKFAIKIPYIGLVNVVAGKKIIPEFLQFNARPKLMAEKAIELLKDKEELNSIKRELAKVKDSLGGGGANRRAAEVVVKKLRFLD